MTNSQISFDPSAARYCRAGVSLHGHTLHSHEPLDFIYRFMKTVAPLRAVVAAGVRRYKEVHNGRLDFNRAHWTPPVAPLDALQLEAAQITAMGLHPLVSLTDHDNIEAALSLHVLDHLRAVPISVEWTVPYRATFFHVGVHNLNPDSARATWAALSSHSGAIAELLAAVAADRAALIVFNHPLWDEKGIGQQEHNALAMQFALKHAAWLHAIELNGMRPWRENREARRMAERLGKPVVSGGDRHALEPNTMLNVTHAETFDEFAAEVRGGASHVVVMPRYREPFSLRILQNLQDVLSLLENHGRGWKQWDDRVFYICDDGETRSLSTLWGNRPPVPVGAFVGAVQALRHRHLQFAFRMAFARRQEALL